MRVYEYVCADMWRQCACVDIWNQCVYVCVCVCAVLWCECVLIRIWGSMCVLCLSQQNYRCLWNHQCLLFRTILSCRNQLISGRNDANIFELG